jgi:hypothetical protein
MEDGYQRLVNTDHILYSFKRGDGDYGLLMTDKSKVWLTWREFDQLVTAIAKGSDGKDG